MNDFIFDERNIPSISPKALDDFLENGWRHFGQYFFRYNLTLFEGQFCQVIPLRIKLEKFTLSKSQRKLWRKNQGFHKEIGLASIDKEKLALFKEHRQKFTYNPPNSIYDFLDPKPETTPCPTWEIRLYDQKKLIACSFFDVSGKGVSSIYGMFDLSYQSYGLGLYTMLLEIEYAQRLKKEYYYHGYCFNIPSFYDYKKRFFSLEQYNWNGGWYPMERV